MALEQNDRRRLAQLMGMTGSAIDAEALSFLRGAERLIRDRGETWDSVIVPRLERDRGESWRPPPPPPEPDYYPELRALQDETALLTQWERDFVASLLTRDFPVLTPRQREVVERIKSDIVRRRVWKGTRS